MVWFQNLLMLIPEKWNAIREILSYIIILIRFQFPIIQRISSGDQVQERDKYFLKFFFLKDLRAFKSRHEFSSKQFEVLRI